MLILQYKALFILMIGFGAAFVLFIFMLVLLCFCVTAVSRSIRSFCSCISCSYVSRRPADCAVVFYE